MATVIQKYQTNLVPTNTLRLSTDPASTVTAPGVFYVDITYDDTVVSATAVDTAMARWGFTPVTIVGIGNALFALQSPDGTLWDIVIDNAGVITGVRHLSTLVVRAPGTNSVGAAAATPGAPASTAVGDMLLIFVSDKYPANVPTVPAGWTLLGQEQSTKGAAHAPDAGDVFSTVFWRIADGTALDTPAIAVVGGNVTMARIGRITKDATATWDTPTATTGRDNTPGLAYSAAGALDLAFKSGDVVIAATAINTNDPIFSGSGVSMVIPGCTVASQTTVDNTGSSIGDDIKQLVYSWIVVTGPSSGVPTFNATASTSGAEFPIGATVFVRLRQIP